MTTLARLLAERIRAGGPVSVDSYLALSMGHPDYGYYARRQPIGARGDFITAPEISQMFGELVGLWCADAWHMAGRPSHAHLVELGPGKGTLMADALRAISRAAPEFGAGVDIHLVETSPALRGVQRATLRKSTVSWHSHIEQVPAGPLFVIANEFFDALPIRQVVQTEAGWAERVVTLLPGTETLRFAHGPLITDPQRLPPGVRADAPAGTIAEDCPDGTEIAALIASRLARDGGAALIIDYGYCESGPGDTLQAVSDHRYADALEAPGESDLTAHVDFAALIRTARAAGAVAWGPRNQGAFLTALGIAARAERLKRDAAAEPARAIDQARERLIAPAQMGELFKVAALTAPGAPIPAGFGEP